MDYFVDILADATIDTLRLVPFLLVTYMAIELLEHKAHDKVEGIVRRSKKAGPLVGAALGIIPQCGFSAMAAALYAGRVVGLGTLLAVFLATSDEMLPIFIAEGANPIIAGEILGWKFLISMMTGFLIHAAVTVTHRHQPEGADGGARLGVADGAHNEEHNEAHPILSAIRHTLTVSLFIFLVSLALSAVIEGVGEDVFAAFIAQSPIASIFASALVGLIPNCAASVIITELFLDGALNAGAMMSGLLVSAGVGLLVLYRTNHSLKENLFITALLYGVGVFWGLVIYCLGIPF